MSRRGISIRKWSPFSHEKMKRNKICLTTRTECAICHDYGSRICNLSSVIKHQELLAQKHGDRKMKYVSISWPWKRHIFTLQEKNLITWSSIWKKNLVWLFTKDFPYLGLKKLWQKLTDNLLMVLKISWQVYRPDRMDQPKHTMKNMQ